MNLIVKADISCKKEIANEKHESKNFNFNKNSKVCQTKTLNVKPIIYHPSIELKSIKRIEKSIQYQPFRLRNVSRNDESKPSINKNILNDSNYKQISKIINENNKKKYSWI